MLTPDAIEAQSFAIIDSEARRRSEFSEAAWSVVRRLLHTAGDVALETDVVVPEESLAVGVEALQNGAALLTDTRMALAGISVTKLCAASVRYESYPPVSLLARPGLADASASGATTRSAAAVRDAAADLPGAILVIGNAPTALEAALDLIRDGLIPPALIIGMPVGFVGAVESKERLVLEAPCPYLTIRGRRGGSNLAAAAVNALAVLAAAANSA